MNQPNTYLDNQLRDKLKNLRTYESETYAKWGNRKRIFKMVGVDMMDRAFQELNIECEKSGYHQIQPNVRSFRFDNKNILVCDTDEEKPLLIKIHKEEKDISIFSIEELLRCIPNDIMEAKKLLSKLDKSVNIQSIKYG